MRIHVQKLFRKLPDSQDPGTGLCRTYEVEYDPDAADRVFALTEDLEEGNYTPCTIVAGLRAYLSLYVRTFQQEHNRKNATELWILADGGVGAGFKFDGFRVELDMITTNDDEIRVTCDMAGVAKLLESRPYPKTV